MNYNLQLIKKENYTPTYWSGGMATELITYPVDSNYANRNFLWRLGVAKIDISESTFSNLPNVSRHLMVTQGKMNLEHENRYIKTLSPFEQDTFMGDWSTKTYGKASVFNLMTRENYDGELMCLSIRPKDKTTFIYNLSYNKEIIAVCFYPVYGGFKSYINNKIFEVQNGDLLYINYFSSSIFPNFILYNTSREFVKIIVSIIYRK